MAWPCSDGVCADLVLNVATAMSMIKPAIFRTVNVRCTQAPSRTPIRFTADKTAMRASETILLMTNVSGMKWATYIENVTASQAVPPESTANMNVQPLTNAQSGPYASRKYTYCPPVAGIMAPNSA